VNDVVALTYLASSDHIAYAMGRLSIPVGGVILVIVGIVLELRGHKSKNPPGGHPPQTMWQSPYPPPPPGSPQAGVPLPPGLYPAPPYPQPAAPPVWTAAHPPVAQTSKKNTGTTLVIIGLVIVGLSVISAVGSGRATEKRRDLAATTLKVGQCITDTAASKADLTPSSCEDPNSVLELVARSDTTTCPAGIGTAQYSKVSDGKISYCFVPNLKQGLCYVMDGDREVLKVDDCSAHRSILIAKRVDGSTDGSVCDTSSQTAVFVTPPRVYCLGRS
jgi:hypothetical protein